MTKETVVCSEVVGGEKRRSGRKPELRMDLLREQRWLGRRSVTVATGAAVVAVVAAASEAGLYYQTLVGSAAAFAVAALGYNIALGYAGQFIFCQAAFMAVGAYGFALMEPTLGQAGAAVAVLCLGTGIGAVLGATLLRVTDIYLALVTLAFGQALLIIPNVWTTAGGDNGLSMELAGENAYVVAVVILGVLVLVVDRALRSRIGRGLALVKYRADAAAACGVSVTRMKMGAVAVSGGLGALGGVLLGGVVNFFTPASFSLSLTLTLLAMVVILSLIHI